MERILVKEELVEWQKRKNDALNDAYQNNPSKPVGSVIDDAWKQFLRVRWIVSAREGIPKITPQEYEKMEEEFGPDLTALPLKRYSKRIRGSKPNSDDKAPRKEGAYRRYIKQRMGEISKDTSIKPSERLMTVNREWRALSDEQKKKYAPIE